ncbi:tRNA 4-thiouridine(8) synthase ThiI [Patescibacteria group bacterium]|nr:tRNA 4-thiouridine(8) synthase ThiI [Patescibacteria group bacterium]
MKKKKIKCLALFSGGLDSILAVKVLEKQGIAVTAVNFPSHFFDSKQAEISAKKNKIKLKIINNDFPACHWKIVKKPKYGYGRAMNPCIDCHLLMIKKAGELMKKEKYDFVATGEVLGQRVFSQNKNALKNIEKYSGIKGRLLRPLSAKLLELTEVEKLGLVDRNKLFDFNGKSRKQQIKLAKKLKISYYPSPAGGCLLTDKEFGRRLKTMMEKFKADNITPNDLALLKLGRHFWFENNLAIVGRNKGENEKLEKLKQKKDKLLVPKFPGPSVLIKGKKIDNKLISKAKDLIFKYSKIMLL